MDDTKCQALKEGVPAVRYDEDRDRRRGTYLENDPRA
jgi:hypothetical protein